MASDRFLEQLKQIGPVLPIGRAVLGTVHLPPSIEAATEACRDPGVNRRMRAAAGDSTFTPERSF